MAKTTTPVAELTIEQVKAEYRELAPNVKDATKRLSEYGDMESFGATPQDKKQGAKFYDSNVEGVQALQLRELALRNRLTAEGYSRSEIYRIGRGDIV